MKRKHVPADFWISNCTLLTQDEDRRILRNASVRVVGDTIVKIVEKPVQTKSYVNGTDRLLSPGFVQTHLHLCQTGFRGMAEDVELLDWLRKFIYPFEGKADRSAIAKNAEIGIRELLASGTTCILDMGTVRHTEAIFESARDLGIRANIGKCLMDDGKSCPKDLCEPTDAAMKEAAMLFDKWNGFDGDRIRASFAPRFALSCTQDLLMKVASISRDRGALVHTHACENQGELAEVRKFTGYSNIEYLKNCGLLSDRLVLAHGVWLTDADKKALRKARVNLAHCPTSNLKLGSGICDVPGLRKLGIRVSLGSDGAACNNRLSQFSEMRLAGLIQKPIRGVGAIGAQILFDLATREGAKALHWWDSIGSIEVGKKADFFLMDGDFDGGSDKALVSNFVYAGESGMVDQTWVAGKRVYRRQRK